MRLHLLHLDDALELQPHFTQACNDQHACNIDLRAEGGLIRLWARNNELERLKHKLASQMQRSNGEPRLCYMGSGDFHHISALLLELALEDAKVPVTVIHFDNHPDWVRFSNGVHCGSWVNRALDHPLVEKLITIGPCSNDLQRPEWKGANLDLIRDGKLELYPYSHAPSWVWRDYGSNASHRQLSKYLHWNRMIDQTEPQFIRFLQSRIATSAVYVTVDKDVLQSSQAVTNWDQGQMSLDYLMATLRAIRRNHYLIGADIIGDYSRPHYEGNAGRRMMKRAEILLDQPSAPTDLLAVQNLNSHANLALLSAFTQVVNS